MLHVKWKKVRILFPTSTHRTAVHEGPDVGVVVVRHLLVVGAQEADGLVVVALPLVVPRHRVVAVVRHVLPGGGAQQTQEGHLDHAHGVAFGVHVGQLWGGKEKEKARLRRDESGPSEERRLMDPIYFFPPSEHFSQLVLRAII